MLEGKNILIGVTGSIAAYKAAELTRFFIKAGARVKVIMTTSACDFITPLTLSVLSKNKVLADFYSPGGEWNNHVELASWADVFVIAPLSANTMAKMANGISDNILLTTYLSAACPVYFAPAMDLEMYRHTATQKNIATLLSAGHKLIPPGNGELASGLTGEGRMEDPAKIVEIIAADLLVKNKLLKKKVLVTAGPTYESIDPVRFIGNHSSGKMGFAIAEAMAGCGAEVSLVSGPSSLKILNPSVKRHNVTSAEEMYEACMNFFPGSDIAVMCAAVADYKPASVSEAKIKKSEGSMELRLLPTRDILASMGKIKKKNQILAGFALETENEEENAAEKLKKKNLDFIVLNSMKDKGAGFGGDFNKISIIGRDHKHIRFELKSKRDVASDIVNKCISLLDCA